MSAPRNNNPVNGINEETLSQILKAALDAYAEEDREKLAATLREEFAKLEYNVEVIGNPRGNNKNFKITDRNDNTKVFVVQATIKSKEAESAFLLLRDGAGGMPDIYDDQSVKLAISKDDMTIHVAAMEYCPRSLDAARKECQDDDSRLQLAVNVGAQVSGILTSVKEKSLIWTDLKVGNLLMRDDSQIVVTDLKGFVDPNKLSVRQKGTLQFPEITQECVSKNFLEKDQMNTKTYDEVKTVMDRENSYQMAIILYYIATGENRYSAVETKGKEETEFDFKKPIFATDEGARLKTVIESLSDNNPEKRIRHEHAMKMLQVLDKPDEFKAEKNAAVKYINRVSSVTSKAEVVDRAITERLAREAQATRFDKFKNAVGSVAEKIGFGKSKSKSDSGIGTNQESKAGKDEVPEHKVSRTLSNK